MLTKNISRFLSSKKFEFSKNFLPVDSSGSEVSKKSGGKKNFDLRKKI